MASYVVTSRLKITREELETYFATHVQLTDPTVHIAFGKPHLSADGLEVNFIVGTAEEVAASKVSHEYERTRKPRKPKKEHAPEGDPEAATPRKEPPGQAKKK